MTDQSAWAKRLVQKYRKYPKSLRVIMALITVPFVIPYWMAQHYEAIFESFDPPEGEE